MTDTPVSRFIDELKLAVMASSDEELARGLGVGKSTIASWRRRGTIPKAVEVRCREQHGVDWHRIRHGKPRDEEITDALFRAAFYASILLLGRDLREEEIPDFASWLAGQEGSARDVLARPLFSGELGRHNTVESHARLLALVLAGRHGTPKQLREAKDEMADELNVPRFPNQFRNRPNAPKVASRGSSKTKGVTKG